MKKLFAALVAALVIVAPLGAQSRIVATGPTHDGETIRIHIPDAQHIKNVTGTDGAGLCVFASAAHNAKFMNLRHFEGIFDYMKSRPGGGWPEKLDRVLADYARSIGRPLPEYIQHTGGDAEFLRLALKTGRAVAITYAGADGVYYSGTIGHMVNLVHFSDRWAAILDNNYPGKYLWMPPGELLKRWRGMGGGWAFAYLSAPPAPVPVNATPEGTLGEALGNLNKQLRAQVMETVLDDGKIFGVDGKRIEGAQGYRISGREVGRDEALARVGASLIDDSARMTLTVYGPQELISAVDRMIDAPDLAGVRSRIHYQRYAQADWDANAIGLAPGITLQGAPGPDGKAKVIWRFRQLPNQADFVEGLRIADPNYRPDRDPEPIKPKPSPAPTPTPDPVTPAPTPSGPSMPWPLAGILGVVGFALYRLRERWLKWIG